jgi:hypothetical protein
MNSDEEKSLLNISIVALLRLRVFQYKRDLGSRLAVTGGCEHRFARRSPAKWASTDGRC